MGSTETKERSFFVRVIENTPNPDLDFNMQFYRIVEKEKCVQVIVIIPKKEII